MAWVMPHILFKKNLNASKPSDHPPSGEKMSKGLVGGNIGCRDKTYFCTIYPCDFSSMSVPNNFSNFEVTLI